MSIADEIVEGESCQECCKFTGHSVEGKKYYEGWGFPVLCGDCAKGYPKKQLRYVGKECAFNGNVYQLMGENK